MIDKRVLLRVSIFIDKSMHAVRHCASVVLHSEFLLPFPPRSFHKTLVITEFALYVREIGTVRSLI